MVAKCTDLLDLGHSARNPGSILASESLSVWRLHALPVSAWVSSRCSGFLPCSKDVWVRLIGHDKLPLIVRGTSRVNMRDYEDRSWVGLLEQARWAKWPLLPGRHGSTVVSTAASQLQGPGFDSRLWVTVCVEFAHSPRVCVGFLRVLRFPPTVQRCVG